MAVAPNDHYKFTTTVACGWLAIFSTRKLGFLCLLPCTSCCVATLVITRCYFSRLNSLQFWTLVVYGPPAYPRHGPFFSRQDLKDYILWPYSDGASCILLWYMKNRFVPSQFGLRKTVYISQQGNCVVLFPKQHICCIILPRMKSCYIA